MIIIDFLKFTVIGVALQQVCLEQLLTPMQNLVLILLVLPIILRYVLYVITLNLLNNAKRGNFLY